MTSPLFLSEGAGAPVLYHYTSIYAAWQIMTSGKFKLTPARGSLGEYSFSRGYDYFMSFSRIKEGDYTLQSSYKFGVVFNFDGRKLEQTYKIVPVDYWERSWLAKPGSEQYRTSESEDRLLTDHPSINLAAVTEIHVLADFSDKVDMKQDGARIRQIALMARMSKRPIFFYKHRRDWYMQVKSRALPQAEIIGLLKSDPKAPLGSNYAARLELRDYFEPWRELYYKNDEHTLSEKASDLLYRVRYHYATLDRQLAADIHNERKAPGKNLIKMMQVFKKAGAKTVEDFVQYLHNKWAKNRVAEAVIDNKDGMGATPNNANVDYLGLRVMMKPSVFLSLAAPLTHKHDRYDDLKQKIANGEPIGSPFLSLRIPNGWENGDLSSPAIVVGHEGRHRMSSILETEGDVPHEVHIFLGSWYRRRHITDEMIAAINKYLVPEEFRSTQRYVKRGPFFKLINT